jgi:hypothetical protein
MGCKVEHFLGVFAKLQEVAIGFVLSIHLPAWNSSAANFYEILHFSVFRKSIEKIQFSLKSYKNKRYFI